MWRFLLLVLVLHRFTLAPSATIPSKSQDSKKCCPCPSTLRSEPEDPAELSEPSEESINPFTDSENEIPPEDPGEVVAESSGKSRVRSSPGCTCRPGDMASSGSTPLRSVSRPDKLGSPPPKPTPIFRPEVGLANSLLETFRAANEEELKEARLRASSRSNTLGSARRTATIIINNPSSGSQNSLLGASRFSPSLGKTNSLLGSSMQPLAGSTQPSLGNAKSFQGSSLRNNPRGRPNSLLRSSLLNPARLSGGEKSLTSQRSGLLGLGTLRAADSYPASSVTSPSQAAPSGLEITPALRASPNLRSVTSAFAKPQLGSANSGILQSRLGSALAPPKQGSANSGIFRLGSPRSTISQTRLGNTNSAISQPSWLDSRNVAISQPILASKTSGISQPSRLRSENSALPKPHLGIANAVNTQNRLGNSLLRPALPKVPLLGNTLGSSRIESDLIGNNLGLSPSLSSAPRPRLLSRLGSLGSRRLKNAPLGLANQAPAILGSALTNSAGNAVARAGLLGATTGLRSKIDDMAGSASDVVGQRVPFLGSQYNKLGSSLTHRNAGKISSNLPYNGLLRDGLDLIDEKPVDPLEMIFKLKKQLLDVIVGNPNVKEEDADSMDGESTHISNVVKLEPSENLKQEISSSENSVDDIAEQPVLKSTSGGKISKWTQNIKGARNPAWIALESSKSANNLADEPLKQEVLSSDPDAQLDNLMGESENVGSNSPTSSELFPKSSNLSLEKPKKAFEDASKLSVPLTTKKSKPELLKDEISNEQNLVTLEQRQKSREKLQLPKVTSLKERLQNLRNPQLSSPLTRPTSKPDVIVQPDDLMDKRTDNSQSSNLPKIPKLSVSTQKLETEPTIVPNTNAMIGETPKSALRSDSTIQPEALKNDSTEKPVSRLPTSPLSLAKLQAFKLPSLRDRLQKLLNLAPKSVVAETPETESSRSVMVQPKKLNRLANTSPSITSEFPKSISTLIGTSNDKSGTSSACEALAEDPLEYGLKYRADTEIEKPNSRFDYGEPVETNVLPEKLRSLDDCERCYAKDTEVVAKQQNPTKVYNCKLVCNK